MTKIKEKERVLKAASEKKKVMYIRLSVDFSAEILQARREWCDIVKGMKGKNL